MTQCRAGCQAVGRFGNAGPFPGRSSVTARADRGVMWLLGASLYRRRVTRSLAGHLSNHQELSKTRYCGTGVAVIQEILEYVSRDLEQPVASQADAIRAPDDSVRSEVTECAAAGSWSRRRDGA